MSVKSQGAATAASKVIYDITTADLDKDPPMLLEVGWEDHSSSQNWVKFKEAATYNQPPVVWTVGRRIYEDKKVIVLASSVAPSWGDCFHTTTILKCAEISRRELTYKRKKK